MGTWYFWEQYKQALRLHQALDKFSNQEVQRGVVTDTSSLLDREADPQKVSRFLYAIQRMPKAWGSRPWCSHELVKAGNVVANDLFRRKMKRDLGLR